MTTHWLDMSEEETEEIVRKLEYQMGTPLEYHTGRLVQVIQAQHEGLADNGWYEVFCVDCDKSSESFRGSIEDAAKQFIQDGWTVQDLDRSQAICSACVNAPDTDHYASQYADGSGILG